MYTNKHLHYIYVVYSFETEGPGCRVPRNTSSYIHCRDLYIYILHTFMLLINHALYIHCTVSNKNTNNKRFWKSFYDIQYFEKYLRSTRYCVKLSSTSVKAAKGFLLSKSTTTTRFFLVKNALRDRDNSVWPVSGLHECEYLTVSQQQKHLVIC